MSSIRAEPARLIGDHDGQAGVRAQDGAHGVYSLDVAGRELAAARTGDVDAVPHHKRPRQELQGNRGFFGY